jgi:DNA replication protein DnaC
LPIERQGANLFFQLISRRYERGPMVLTSNQSFAAWGDVFGDRVIATAILGRLLLRRFRPSASAPRRISSGVYNASRISQTSR